MLTQPKVLTFDIESTPMTAHVWGLKDQNIGLNQIVKDWSVLSFAAKWMNEDKVIYHDTSRQKDITDDTLVCAQIWKLLDEADIVITQYGSGFDSPKLNARFIEHGFKPPKPYKHLDTYRIVKRVAAFTSNKLEYLTDKLCTKYKKLKHAKFPGHTLWVECLKRNKQAWAEMKRYNIHDVLSTEELYTKLRAWAPSSMPSPYAYHKLYCAICSEGVLVRRGFSVAKAGRYQRFQCSNCGHWTQGKKETI